MTIKSLVVVVRPNVAPDIRPPKPTTRIETEDENDTEIIGRTGHGIDLSHSHSYSVTFIEKAVEQYRIFDKVRIVPKKDVKDPNTFDPSKAKRYFDMEMMHYIQYKDEFGHLKVEKFRKPETNRSEGIFVMEENIKKGVK
jgi:hypothetical protein